MMEHHNSSVLDTLLDILIDLKFMFAMFSVITS